MKSANYHSARPACPGDIVIETNSGFVKPKFEVFINKTLNYVSLQLCITTLIVYYMYSNRENVIDRLSKEPGLVWTPIIFTFISLLGMHFCVSARKTMFWIFTICCSFMVGISVLQYSPGVVMNAVVTTCIIVIIANAYSYWCAKNGKDLAALEPILGMSLLVLIVAGLINMVLKLALVHFLLTILGVFVFTMFLVFDLNRLYMTDDNQAILEDPMLAAVGIYLDIINLFLYLLELYDKVANCEDDSK